jgi:hypothetical protein
MHIADQPLTNDPQPAPPVFIDELVAETAQAVADLTRVVNWLASTKTPTGETAAAIERLRWFVERINR